MFKHISNLAVTMKTKFFIVLFISFNFVYAQNHQTSSAVTTYATGTSLDSIVSSIGTNNATLHINKSVTVISNLIIPENISLKFYNGSTINIGTNTLTINGSMEAGVFQIFTGSGVVNGSPKIEHAIPQWWKNINSTDVNWSNEIQKAIDFYPKVFFPKLDPNSLNVNLHAYHIQNSIILDLSKPHYLYGVGSQSLLTTYYYPYFNDYIIKCTNIPPNFNLGLEIKNLEFRCNYGIALNGGETINENFTQEDKIITRAKISNCYFIKHNDVDGQVAILLKKTFDSEISNNKIEGFNTGILLQGSDLNYIHDNRVVNFKKYAICDLAYNYFGSQNLISHNDLLSFLGSSSDKGSFIKTNSRHIMIRDNYMENNNINNKLLAYVDCSKVGLPEDSNYTDFSKNIEITGNRCDIISNDCAKYMYFINEKFKSLNLVEIPNLNDNFTNGSSFGKDSYNEEPVSHILMKVQYTPEWDKEINMVNCESFKGWEGFSTSKKFNHSSNGDIIINSRNISFSSTNGDYPMQRFNGKSFLLEPNNSIFIKLDSNELFKNINVKIKLRNYTNDTNSNDLYFAIKATTTTQNLTYPLYWLDPIDVPNGNNYSMININIPIPFPYPLSGYPTDRFDINKNYYLQIHAKNSIKEIKEIIIEDNTSYPNSSKQNNSVKPENSLDENNNQEKIEILTVKIGEESKIYPNPTSNIINFEIKENTKIKSVELYTVNGTLIGNYTNKIQNNSLDLSSLPSGNYLLQITSIINQSEIIIKE